MIREKVFSEESFKKTAIHLWGRAGRDWMEGEGISQRTDESIRTAHRHQQQCGDAVGGGWGWGGEQALGGCGQSRGWEWGHL